MQEPGTQKRQEGFKSPPDLKPLQQSPSASASASVTVQHAGLGTGTGPINSFPPRQAEGGRCEGTAGGLLTMRGTEEEQALGTKRKKLISKGS